MHNILVYGHVSFLVVCRLLVVPCLDDHSRIRLQRNNVDYINASLVEVPDAQRAYILTQVFGC